MEGKSQEISRLSTGRKDDERWKQGEIEKRYVSYHGKIYI